MGKRAIIWGLSIALLSFGFAACGEDSDTAQQEPPEPIETSAEPSPTATAPAEEPEGPPDVTVRGLDNEFKPKELALRGRSVVVRFVNRGNIAHTFTSMSPEFDTGIVAPGDSALVEFDVPDSAARFYCKLHRGMEGELIPRD